MIKPTLIDYILFCSPFLLLIYFLYLALKKPTIKDYEKELIKIRKEIQKLSLKMLENNIYVLKINDNRFRFNYLIKVCKETYQIFDENNKNLLKLNLYDTKKVEENLWLFKDTLENEIMKNIN